MQGRGQGLRVGHDLLLVGLELGRERFLEGHGLGRDHVHERPALHAREDELVQLLGPLRLAEDRCPPRGPRSVLWVVVVTNSAVRHRARMEPGGHEARDVGDVRHDHRAHLVRGLAHRREVDGARVGAGPHHDDASAGARGRGRAISS